MSISRTAFRRMITECREPEFVRREVEHFIEGRKRILSRDCKITDRGEYFERLSPDTFTRMLKQYREYERERGATRKKRVKSLKPLKKNAIRRGPRVTIRFETLRHKSEVEAAAEMRGMSVNHWVRTELDAAAQRIIYGE